MIAPYWGDVDIRPARSATSNQVYWHLQPGLMVVTWHNVGYYNQRTNLRMDFQMLLRNALGCGMGDFDVEFRYNRCEWTTGDASGGSGGFGGTPAQAGFDAGNGTDFVEIPGSRTMAILNLCTTSNVGEPGIWRFSVRGGAIDCPDAGAPCDTGMQGACAIGVTQCVGRDIVCAPVGRPSAERCDGIDNDCDGSIDDGDLCGGLDVCVRGTCVPPCFEGGCLAGETCTTEGICVETACADVTCPAGERCRGGVCVGACEGIVCPYDRQCVAGRCIDLCDVLTCGEGEICVEGECRPQCPCTPCADGEVCLADGSCESLGCDIVICDPGFYCSGGSCLDACAGAVCPAGQACVAGDCVDAVDPGPDPTADAGGPGPVPGTDAGGGEVGIDGGAGGDVDGGRTPGTAGEPGCGCAVIGEREASGALWLAGMVLATLLRRRRR
ncbi:MAG: hypothetical protein KF901_18010 [Myxococcales bacterium]|nr:hypothetical protein [Myxococcales bacterium]